MGTYVYSLRASHEKVKINGVKEKVHYFSYAYKPHWGFFSDESKSIKMMMGRLEKYWEGKVLPKYAVNMDKEWIVKYKNEEVYSVYTNLKSYIWNDDRNFPGSHCGGLYIKDGVVKFVGIQESYDICKRIREDKIKNGKITVLA